MGRPRKDGLPGINDTIISAPPGFVPPESSKVAIAGPGGSPLDQAAVSLCRKSIVAGIKALDWLLKEVVRIKADAAAIDPAFTEKVIRKAEPDPKAMEDFQNSLDAVLKKHNFKPEHDEEWALAIDAGRLFAPYVLLLTTFNAEIARLRQERFEKLAEQTKRTIEERENNRGRQ